MRLEDPSFHSTDLKAEVRLANLINREMAIEVNPSALRRFLEVHWSKASALAHQIHDAADRYAHIPAGDG